MNRTLRILSLILGLLLLAAFSSKGATAGTDPGVVDTVVIDTTIAYLSGTGVVPIHFYNDEPLFGLEVTIAQPDANISIDSFSFVGGRVETASFKNVRLNEDSTKITISVLSGTINIPAGSGLLGALYLSYPSNIAVGIYPIDTVTWRPEPTKEYGTKFYLPDVTGFTPHVVQGALDIEANPPTPDSLWVVPAEAYPGQPLAVSVYLYNERAAKAVSLALGWGSSYLRFDSVTYGGTRAAAAQTKKVQYSNSLHQLLADIEFGEIAPLDPGSGVFMQLFFSVRTAPDTTVFIDTVTFAGIQSTFLTLTIADGNLLIAPIYHRTAVHINEGTPVDDEPDHSLPVAYALGQNYPNPFNPSTRIEFALPKADHVRIDLYDILGRTVRTLVDEEMTAGVHTMTFDGRGEDGRQLATGVYFYRMTTSSFTKSRKMLLLK